MRVSLRTEWPMWLLLGSQFMLAAFSWPVAPDRIPTHWGLDGQVDGYGDRFQGLLLLPLVSLGLYLALIVAPQIDPKGESYHLYAGSYAVLRFAILAVMTAMYGMVHLALRGYEMEMNRAVTLSLGALFLVIGSQLGRLRPNWFVGLDTPWTLSSQESWERTNRLAGRLLIAAGAVMLVAGLVGSALLMVAAVAGTVVGAVGLVLYSYRRWVNDPEKDRIDTV